MAQQPATQPANGQSIESPIANPRAAEDRHIALDVAVADRAGNPISGLQQQDFTVLDNKLPQKLVSFRAVTEAAPGPPSEVILLVDAVNTSFTSVSYERGEIVKFLGMNGGKLAQPVSIIFFTDTKTSVQNAPSRDGTSLIAAFDKNVTGLRSLTRSAGYYGAVDRLELSLKTLGNLSNYEITKPGRKLLIWISPGWPLLSGPRTDMSNKQAQMLFANVVAMSAALRRARITVYAVDPLGTADAGDPRTFYYQEFLKGVTKPNSVQAGNLSLQVLAVQSGGRVLNGSNDIAGEISRCTKDAETYYQLSFDSAPAEHPNEYHTLQVVIDKPGLTARTRAGYYAEP